MVTISDSGPGVPESLQAKLFKPFFTTKGELGTGLGLWVSRGIVEKHGGKIELTNSTDPAYPGAAVRVYLPALGPGVRRRDLRPARQKTEPHVVSGPMSLLVA